MENNEEQLPDRATPSKQEFIDNLVEGFGVDRDIAEKEYNRVFPFDLLEIPVTRERIEQVVAVVRKNYPPRKAVKLGKRKREAVERLGSGYYLEKLKKQEV